MTPTETQKAYDDVGLGIGAETVLQTLQPDIERRLIALLDQFGQCEPKLEILLDFRAKISELHRIRRELGNMKKKGRVAASELKLVIGSGG